MKTTIEMARVVRLGLLMTAGLASFSVAATNDAAEKVVPHGVHMQSAQLAPELVKKTREETDKAIARGEQLWKDRSLGTNGQNCNICHADGAATHPETYPKFKQQYGRVVTVQEFDNWCIMVALRGQKQELGGEVLTALEAYQAYTSRGQNMEIGVPGP